MPQKANPPPLALGVVEDPTFMPGPRDIPSGEPNDPAPPPGRVPPGDSRSLRRDEEFALIYRVGTYVITRLVRSVSAVSAGGRIPYLVLGEPLVREGVLALRLGGLLGLS